MPETNAILTSRRDIAPGLAILRVEPDGWSLPDFKPGQFATLGLPADAPRGPEAGAEEPGTEAGFIRRAYSIASSSREKAYLEFYIVEVPSGALTPRLFALRPGDRLWLGPRMAGLFTLDRVAPDRNLVLVATGTGLAPYMSMLRTDLLAHPERRLAVLHGARHAAELGYREELFHLQRDAPNFSYLPVISRPEAEPRPWPGATGHLQDFWATAPLAALWGFRPGPGDTDVFLCGNPQMVRDLTALLAAEGFREHSAKVPGQIHFEKYW